MRRITLLTAALAIALGVPFAASAQPAPDASTALDRINATGNIAPYELEYRHGFWTAEGTTSEGLRVDILVDPDTGEVLTFDSRGSGAISSAEVRRIVLAAGYVRVSDIEFDDGFWEAEAVDASGREIDLVLHPVSGEILTAPRDPAGATPLSATEITAKLTAAGYSRISDLEFDDDGYWEADAVNARGQHVDLRVDAHSGAVIREKLDD